MAANAIQIDVPTTPTPAPKRNVRFQNALARIPQATPPIWLMRQAGRYHRHYQNLRRQFSFMDLCLKSKYAGGVKLSLDFFQSAWLKCGTGAREKDGIGYFATGCFLLLLDEADGFRRLGSVQLRSLDWHYD